ncbi:hypothetical protein HPB49_023647 [Dermacentor silvarum]|uniref:Uncharacterized protein n=1 Tax=Dermacentor silvarum TaxID=543639 RepID=A0ACB8E483_DERSI|nr:hypothetical protein HPB49_023647 [Dermacentor silvarum]
MAAMDDNFVEFVNYLERHDELMRGAAFSYTSPPRRVLRDRLNPMEVYDDYEFLCRYRFTKRTVQQLLDRLPLRENTDGRGFPVPPLLQLLITLRFYGAGTFQIVTGDLVNVSQPTVSRGITGPDQQFYDVVASWPGSAHDSRIFDSSCARVLYETGAIPGILLGDMGYACSKPSNELARHGVILELDGRLAFNRLSRRLVAPAPQQLAELQLAQLQLG